MMDEPSCPAALAIQSTLYKITSTVDGGWRLTFDAPDSESEAILKLFALKGHVISLVAVPMKEKLFGKA